MAYLARGWALTPLHDVGGVPGNPCSCAAGGDCRSAGKHPRIREWQRPENLVRTGAQLLATMARWPSSNWGLATGIISGVWALDFDSKNVVDWPAARELIAELDATGTWSQVTGSGGRHWLFALPEDFVPNNGSGRLPAGFDVRGARRGAEGGGQIVIAPSVSGVGAYVVCDAGRLGGEGGPVAAPAGVLDAVRPASPRVALHVPLPMATRDQNQVTRYVVSAAAGELDQLRACWTQRNQRAWRAAARCIELINTGQIDGEAVYAAWWAAAAAHPDVSVHVPDVELLRVWASAERHVGDRPADLSHVGGPSGWGGDAIHFAGAPGVPPLSDGGPGADTATGGASYPQGVGGAVDNWRTGAHSAGQGAHSAGQGAHSVDDDPVAALLAEMLDVDQLRNVAPPAPLINGVLDLDTTAWIIGEPGSYKSFVTLDLAAHVGIGRPWRGHEVAQGDVVYIVAEGARGMRLRVDAWEREYGTLKGVRFLPRPVQASDETAWAVLVEACRRLRPVLVVVDTQARVTLGLEENSNTDMGRYVARVDELRRATGACVLSVHHVARGGKNARGASALDGAQDAELRVERTGDLTVELHVDKQKDQAQGRPVTMRMRLSDGGTDPTTGRDLSSLVVDHLEVPMLGQPGESERDVSKRRALLMYQLVARAREHGGEGLTRDAIKRMFRDAPEIAALHPGAARMAGVRAWDLLVARGRVMREGSSQRFGVFPPPDGAADGLLTMNTGGPDDVPPDGWSIVQPDPMSQKVTST